MSQTVHILVRTPRAHRANASFPLSQIFSDITDMRLCSPDGKFCVCFDVDAAKEKTMAEIVTSRGYEAICGL